MRAPTDTPRELPANIEQEQALLGAVLTNNAALDHVQSLEPIHFYEPIHQKLFAVIVDMIRGGKLANPVTLSPYLSDDLKRQRIGQLTMKQYLARLCAEATTVINAADYARGIIELATRRRIIEACEDIEADALISGDMNLAARASTAFTELARTAGAAWNRYPLTSFRELRARKDESLSLVDGLIPRAGFGVVWGPPKCGKSFWVFDLVMHIACGWSYRGRQTAQGAVVYLALEGGRGFQRRVKAWAQRYLPDYDGDLPFYLLDVPVDLIADHHALIAAIRARLGQSLPAVVVIDTLNRALAGDENKSDDMARFIRASDTIRAEFGCTVLVVHHCGTAGARPRGHSSLTGADDVEISIERDDAGNVIATVTHMKDGEAGAAIVSRLESVTLAVTDDGAPITSCVIVEGDAAVAVVVSKPKVKGAQKIALDQLGRAISEAGEKAPTSNTIPADRLVVPVDTWRRYFYGAMSADQAAKQKAFKRAVEGLQAKNIIGIWMDAAWVV